MGSSSQEPSKKGEKQATVTDEGQDPSAGVTPKAQATQPKQQAQSTHPPSAADYQTAGPGFTHQITNYLDGWSYNTINGYNPSVGQQSAHVHHTAGGAHVAPALAGGLVANFGLIPDSSQYRVPSIQPYHAGSIPTINQLPCFAGVIPPTAASMADYDNGSMPNMGQHFQPPVPDTTHGPIPHTYHPRSDGGVPVVHVGGAAYPQAYPCPHHSFAATHPFSQPVHFIGQSPAAATGIATAPIPVATMYSPTQQQTPVMVQGPAGVQALPAQPVMVAQSAMAPGGIPVIGGQPPVFLGSGAQAMLPASTTFPDVMGVGKTAGDIAMEQLHNAHNTNMMTPEEMAPAKEDPARMYYCRELDGTWTQRNRFTLDRLSCRWYLTPSGVFYAVRLEDA